MAYAITRPDDELVHYGVLGMKWGVKRNPSKAFVKASRKADNLNKEYTKLNLKSARLRAKALNKNVKATNEKQYKKARKLEFKANKLQLESAKQLKKGMKWEKKMKKAFSEVKISDISKESLDRGRKYAHVLIG